MSLETEKQRYAKAMHAMRSAIAFSQNYGQDTQPKHLRVGVNSALISSSALVQLLVEKGILTEEEYVKRLADLTEEEVKMYEEQLPADLKGRVTFG